MLCLSIYYVTCFCADGDRKEVRERSSSESEQQLDIRGLASQQNQFKMFSLKVIELAFLILTFCMLLYLCSLDHKALNLAYDVVREL